MDSQQFISLIADGAVIPVVMLGVYALVRYIPNAKKFEAYSRILMAGLTSYVFAKLIGTIYQPATERPFELLGVEPGASFLDNPGFPSDHALFCMAITLAVLFEVRRKWIGITLIILTLAVCIGRVVALVHTPIDVIGGVAIACVGAIWYLTIPRKQTKV